MRTLACVAAAVLALAAAGCLPVGYQKLKPGQTDVYDAFLADLRDTRAPGSWTWVRGRIATDFDGDLSYGEEAVVATLQDGSPAEPEPVQLAVLLFCRVDDREQRTLAAREVVYDRRQARPPPIASGVVAAFSAAESGDGRAAPDFDNATVSAHEGADPVSSPERKDIVLPGSGGPPEGSGGGKEAVVLRHGRGMAVVSLSTRSSEAEHRVWHFGYAWPEAAGEPARRLFQLQTTQAGVGVWFMDRAPRPSVMVAQRVLPASLVAALPPGMTVPEWLSVWGFDRGRGEYVQADEDFSSQYTPRLGDWLAAYARWIHQGVPAAELAYCEYYLGRMQRLLKEYDQAGDFLEQAANHSANETLRAEVAREKERLNAARREDEDVSGTPPVKPSTPAPLQGK